MASAGGYEFKIPAFLKTFRQSNASAFVKKLHFCCKKCRAGSKWLETNGKLSQVEKDSISAKAKPSFSFHYISAFFKIAQ